MGYVLCIYFNPYVKIWVPSRLYPLTRVGRPCDIICVRVRPKIQSIADDIIDFKNSLCKILYILKRLIIGWRFLF